MLFDINSSFIDIYNFSININENYHFDNIFHIEYSNATIININLNEGYFMSFIKSINTDIIIANCSFQNLYLIDTLYACIWVENSNITIENISFIENIFVNNTAIKFIGINQNILIYSIIVSKNINITILFSACFSSNILFEDHMIFTDNEISKINQISSFLINSLFLINSFK